MTTLISDDVLRALPRFSILRKALPFEPESAILALVHNHAKAEEEEKRIKAELEEKKNQEKIKQLALSFLAELQNLGLKSESGFFVSSEGLVETRLNKDDDPLPPPTDRIRFRKAKRTQVSTEQSKPDNIRRPAKVTSDPQTIHVGIEDGVMMIEWPSSLPLTRFLTYPDYCERIGLETEEIPGLTIRRRGTCCRMGVIQKSEQGTTRKLIPITDEALKRLKQDHRVGLSWGTAIPSTVTGVLRTLKDFREEMRKVGKKIEISLTRDFVRWFEKDKTITAKAKEDKTLGVIALVLEKDFNLLPICMADNVSCKYASLSWKAPCTRCGRLRRCSGRMSGNRPGRGQKCSHFEDGVCKHCKRECAHSTTCATGKCSRCGLYIRGRKKAVKNKVAEEQHTQKRNAPPQGTLSEIAERLGKQRARELEEQARKDRALSGLPAFLVRETEETSPKPDKPVDVEENKPLLNVDAALKEITGVLGELRANIEPSPEALALIEKEESVQTITLGGGRDAKKRADEVRFELAVLLSRVKKISIKDAQDHILKELGYRLQRGQVRNQLKKLETQKCIRITGKTRKTRYVWLEDKKAPITEEIPPLRDNAPPDVEEIEPITVDVAEEIEEEIPESEEKEIPLYQSALPSFLFEEPKIAKMTRTIARKSNSFVITISKKIHYQIVEKHFRQRRPLAGNFWLWDSVESMLGDPTIKNPLEKEIDNKLIQLQGQVECKFKVTIDPGYRVGWAQYLQKCFVADESVKDFREGSFRWSQLTDLKIPAPATQFITFELFLEKGRTCDYAIFIDNVYPGKQRQEDDVFFSQEARGINFDSTYWDDREAATRYKLIKRVTYDWPRRNGTRKKDFAAKLGVSIKMMDQLLAEPLVVAAIHEAKKAKKNSGRQKQQTKKDKKRKRVVFIGNKIHKTLVSETWLEEVFDAQFIDAEKTPQFVLNKQPDLIVCLTNHRWHSHPSLKKERKRLNASYIADRTLLRVVKKAKQNPQLQWFVDAWEREKKVSLSA